MSRKERSHKLKSDDLDDQERRAEETDDKELRRTKVEEREVAKLIEAYKNFDPHAVKLFKDFPLSGYTRSGLSAAKYEVPTDIQRESIGYALKGQDVLGAAKTGSGKTLAFIIPLLECLYRERWSRFDGVGALVITPTRELAMQIFDVINKVGKFHDFSVALVIGGKDLKFERKRMDRCNIVICTPGRLLQHMNENYLLNCDNLRILILDEADRILDLGFAQTMNAIIEYLPHDRQTLLFSATQTKSVKDLARLSLKDPVYVSVHENAIVTTPDALVQSYIVCELHEKMNVLYSFIRNHRSFKIIVFLSTCKQVKFVYDFFCDMRPGISLLALYGTLHQMRRMQIYNDFCHKQRAVLFATDIASRGLDFPDVNWVVQFDCPEDVDTYIHRAGRTARYQKGGESLLFLLPSEEESMVHHLRCRKIPITKIEVDPSKIRSIQRKAEEFCARRVSQKETAQRAFKAYVKNCFLMKDKSVFNLDKLNLELFSKSLGLVISPRLRFVERAKAAQNQQKKGAAELVEKEQCERQKKQMSLQESINFRENSDDEDDDLFTVKKVEDSMDLSFGEVSDNRQANKKTEKIVSKASTVKRLLKKNIKPNSKIIFDDDGNPIEEFPKAQKSEKAKEQLERVGGGIDIELAKEIMKEEDKVDKQIYREMIKAKHREKRKKLKEKRRKDKNDTTAKVTLTEDTSEVDEANEGEINEGETLEQYIDELPDPDRIYGGKVDEESDQDSSNYHDSNESMEEEDDEESLNDDVFSRKRKRRRYSNDSERMEAGLDLDNAEELALQLIKS